MEYKESPELKEINRLIKELMDLYYEVSLKSSLSESAFDILYALVSMGSGCMQKDIAGKEFLRLFQEYIRIYRERIVSRK